MQARRRFQFPLRTFFGVLTVFMVWLGVIRIIELHRRSANRAAEEQFLQSKRAMEEWRVNANLETEAKTVHLQRLALESYRSKISSDVYAKRLREIEVAEAAVARKRATIAQERRGGYPPTH